MDEKKLILWDIDGTLIVSRGAGMRAMERALWQRFGIVDSLDSIDWAGRTDSWIAHEILNRHRLGDSPQNIHDYLETYLELLPAELKTTQGYTLPGIVDLLEILHLRRDVAQGLLTGNLARGAQLKLQHFRVWHYFQFGAFADDSPRRNDLGPHAVRRAREQHRVDFPPERTFIIGDTPHDIACGKAIGAKTIAVATGKYSVTDLAHHQPTAVFPNFADTTAFLRVIDSV
ncbi:MAG: HAD family hydrolase [Opitutaceae bacterium]|nr:HAD family hydrolase [Opitutaceae bacterium]